MHVPVIARECMSGQRKYVIGMHSTHALHASYAVPILVDAIDSRLPSGRVAGLRHIFVITSQHI